MTTIETAPTAVHIGADELPFVEIGGGNKLKVIQVKEREGLWIVENIFMAGFTVQTHRHTGPVWGYTASGAWKYKEYDYVNRAGSFLYEPAGSVHTLTCVEDDTRVWFHMYGVQPQPRRRRQRGLRHRRGGQPARLLRAVRGAGPAPTGGARRLMVRSLGSRCVRRRPAACVPGGAAADGAGLLAGHGGRAGVLGGLEARRRRRTWRASRASSRRRRAGSCSRTSRRSSSR